MKRRLAHILRSTLPRRLFHLAYGLHAAFDNIRNLLFGYGFLRSAIRWQSVNRQGEAVPWFTYPAIEYLDQLDCTDLSVFEYGCGFSTLYWARCCREVVSVENDPVWQKRMAADLSPNASIVLAPTTEDFINRVASLGRTYDIIVVDGASGISRLGCAKAARPFLREGGLFILDDADDYADAAAFLRQSDLIEVDFAGFNAINGYTKTTSLFLHPSFRPKGRGPTFPAPSICAPRARDNSTHRTWADDRSRRPSEDVACES